jgi:hypothetical protein
MTCNLHDLIISNLVRKFLITCISKFMYIYEFCDGISYEVLIIGQKRIHRIIGAYSLKKGHFRGPMLSQFLVFWLFFLLVHFVL